MPVFWANQVVHSAALSYASLRSRLGVHADVSGASRSPGSASCLCPACLPACLPSAARQDTEPVNHCVAAPLWFPVAAVSDEVTSVEFI